MRLVLVTLAFTLSMGWGLEFSLPDKVTGEVGSFISIPIQTSDEGTVNVESFPGLQLVGTPQLKHGKGLVNMLVLDSAVAGEKPLTVTLKNAAGETAEAQVLIEVKPKAGFSVRAPPGDTVVRGDEVRYAVQISNTGNTADTFRIELVSTLSARIEPDALLLEPGQSGEATLVLDTNDVGDAVTFVRVQSGLNPELKETAVVNMNVLPFAGANELDGPVLGYELEAGGFYQPEGVDYRVNARLNGDLSEFVDIGSNLTFENAINLEEDIQFEEVQVTGNLNVSGEAWSVGYRGLDSLQRLDGGYGPYRGFFALLLGSGYNAGAIYEEGPTTVSLTHETTDINTDTLRAGYQFDLTPELSLTPSVGLTGAGLYQVEDYFLTSLAALDAAFENDALVGNGRVQVNYPFRDDPWRLDASLSKRIQVPIGVTSELALTPEELRGNVSVSEVITEEVSLAQRFSYSGDWGFQRTRYRLSFGTVYSPLLLPLSLRGSIISSLIENDFGVGYSLGATYQFIEGVTFDAVFTDANFLEPNPLLYGASLVYTNEFADLTLAYQHAEESDEVLFGVGGEYEDFAGSLQAGYDFFSDEYLLAATLGYTVDRNYQLLGGATWNEEAFTFRLGANIFYDGGFATPETVVDFFGGRIAGTITGSVFHDLNRNGSQDSGEPFLTGVEVRAGSVSSTVGEDGAFRLTLPPGSYELELGKLPADLGLRQDTTLELVHDETVELSLAIETVVGFTGLVADDANRDGALDEEEARISYAKVILTSAAGEQRTATADDKGAFFFQNLEPGDYTVRLDAGSLPEFFEVTTAPLELELKPGPFPRVTLGATAKPKEVKQTLNAESLSLFVTTRPNPPPPGATLEVSAEVVGNPEAVTVTLGDSEVALEPLEGQTYLGYIKIPEDAQGVANLSVKARRGDTEASQQALVIIDTNATLATLLLNSAFVDPEEPLTASTEFFTEVEKPYLVIGGEQYALEPTSAYTFSVTFNAPETAETYEVELWANDKLYASTRFRVDTGN